MTFTRSQYMLKYQKAKAKLLEYDVPVEHYPSFPLDYTDLFFSTVYYVSEYASAIIDHDQEKINDYKEKMTSCAEFYDAAIKSKEYIQYDLDFFLLGAVAYFFHEDYGSTLVMINELKQIDIVDDITITITVALSLSIKD